MGFLSVWCLLAVVLVAEMTSVASSPSLPGGLSEDKAPNQEVQNLVDSVKDEFLAQANQSVTAFELISYRTQVVAGTNYYAKVNIGGGNIVELKIYRGFDGSVSLIT